MRVCVCVNVCLREGGGFARKARELRTDEDRKRRSCLQAYFVCF